MGRVGATVRPASWYLVQKELAARVLIQARRESGRRVGKAYICSVKVRGAHAARGVEGFARSQ